MLSFETAKNLEETPLFMGIKGRYFMLLVACIITILVLFIFMTVLSIIIHNYGLIFLAFFGCMLLLLISFSVFRKISKPKRYKVLKQRPDLVSNKNLQDFLS